MANYTDKPKKHASRDIAVDKLDFYTEPHKSPKKQDKIKGRPKSGWARFCYAAFPQADDSGGEKVRKIVLIVADPFNTNATASQDQTEEIDVTPLVNTPINPNWDELLATNSDVKGWIKITGTAVNNVVVKSYDNSYYLTHNLYREDSVSGTIFSSYLNKWDGTDDNIILYGHNMISGEFFAHVTHYVPNMASKEPLAFYKVHPTVMLATPSGGCETYKIFAGILANTQSQYGEVFDYVDKTKFYSKDDFNNFIIDVMDRSWFFTDVDLTYGDQLLTLSTCSWPLGKSVDTRWVLFARKVRPGESESVDVTVAEQNLNPKLFDYYYSRMGGSWAGSTWDKSKLLSY